MDLPYAGIIAMEPNVNCIASNAAGNTSVSNVKYGLYPKQEDSVPHAGHQVGREKSKRK